jgi:hypothetical protein
MKQFTAHEAIENATTLFNSRYHGAQSRSRAAVLMGAKSECVEPKEKKATIEITKFKYF